MKAPLALLFRFSVTALLVGLIVVQVNWPSVQEVLSRAAPDLLILSLAVHALAIGVSTYKWQILLRVQGTPVSLLDLLRYYFEGFFANNFLPTNIGGDLGRGYRVAQKTGDAWGARASVLVERITGGVGLVVVGVWGWTAGLARGGSLLTGSPLSQAWRPVRCFPPDSLGWLKCWRRGGSTGCARTSNGSNVCGQPTGDNEDSFQ